jgi:hypothetical protein
LLGTEASRKWGSGARHGGFAQKAAAVFGKAGFAPKRIVCSPYAIARAAPMAHRPRYRRLVCCGGWCVCRWPELISGSFARFPS